MILNDMIARARRLSRTGTIIDDAIVIDWLNEAQRQCVFDVGGIVDVDEGTAKGSSFAAPDDYFALVKLVVANQVLSNGTSDILSSTVSSGTPSEYFVTNGSTIYLDKNLGDPGESYKLVYERFPADMVADMGNTKTSELPQSLHMALVYFAATKLAEENFETTQAERMYANYRNEVQRYLVDAANENRSIFPGNK